MSIDPTLPPVPAPAAPADPTRRRSWIIGAGFVLGALVLYGLLLAASGGDVPKGTSVLGVDIGGMSQAQAVATLDDSLGDQAVQPMEITVGTKTTSVPPEQLGLSFDADATVAAAVAPTYNPLLLLTRLVARDEVEPVVRVDEDVLAGYLEQVGASVSVPAKNGDVRFSETSAEPVEPVDGRGLDQSTSSAALRAAYLRSTDAIVLPVVVVEPAVDQAAVDAALSDFGRPAMSGPVTLRVEGTKSTKPVSVTLSPKQFGPALAMKAATDGSLEPVVKVKVLRAVIDRDLSGVLREPRDATFKVVASKPVVVKSKAGQTVDGDELTAALIAVLPKTSDRTATVGVEHIAPKLTTAQAKGLGVKQLISTFTQPFPYAAYRVTNIGRAARYIDGTVLMPGETFSMNDTVKERTVKNGYTVGTVISGGRFREELGGGVSTITTTMWHTAFYAGMERVEQRGHSFYISRYLPGLEATVAWGSLDLRFRNDAPTAVLIKASITNSSVTVSMYGTKRYDISAEFGPRTDIRGYQTIYDPSPGCVPQGGVEGFRIVVTRVFKNLDGTVVKREKLPTSYNVANNIICAEKPKPAKKPSTPPTPRPKPSGST